MEKVTIKNRKEQNVVVVVEAKQDSKGLVFVMHGLSGSKDQPQVVTFAQAFKEKDFTVVRFDTTNTFGESDGNFEDATLTNYYEDLEDVIAWAKSQTWYTVPFYLVGTSLGGISVILYAEKNPKEVKGLAPIATVVSGKLLIEMERKEDLEKWEKTGWKTEESTSVPGRIKKLKWTHFLDRLKYDVLPKADTLTMPVLLIVGDQDDKTPLPHQQLLYDKLPGNKELHIIKNAPHTVVDVNQLKEIKQIILDWIEKTLGV